MSNGAVSRPDKITTPQLLLGGLQTSHVRNTAKVDMYRAAGRKIFPSEVTGFDSAFLNRDFVRKNQAESKSNFGEWCPGADCPDQKKSKSYVGVGQQIFPGVP
jgi:hypothetical protein